MNYWNNLRFFDKKGQYLNFDYNSDIDLWTGEIILDQISVNLFEVFQLFILEEVKLNGFNTTQYTFPVSKEASSGFTWECGWLEEDPIEFKFFQYDKTKLVSNSSSLVEPVTQGPDVEFLDGLNIKLNESNFVSLNSGNDYTTVNSINSSPLELNISFSAETEDTFKRTLYIKDNLTCKNIAEIVISAESIGEDIRFKTMIENFGYKLLESDSSIFRDTELFEALPNVDYVNIKRKEILLEGHNIYPFIGSYKGVLNAIKFFGYDKLKIVELWKNINPSSTKFGKYIESKPIDFLQQKISYNDKTFTLPNANFKKTSLFKLVYRFNSIVPESFTADGLPVTNEEFDYSLGETLVKLFGLKRKLENEFLPFSSRIIDIVGEGDFFIGHQVINNFGRSDISHINVGIPVTFDIFPSKYNLIHDLRNFNEFLETTGIPKNMVMGPIESGYSFQKFPLGPRQKTLNGLPTDGENILISDIADLFVSYFSNYAPNINQVGDTYQGTSKYLPDKEGIPVGSPIILKNTSFSNLSWSNVNSSWEELNNANKYYDIFVNILDITVNTTYTLTDQKTNESVSYTSIGGDTLTDVRNGLLTEIQQRKNSLVDPWVFYQFTENEESGVVGIKIFGEDPNRFTTSTSDNSIRFVKTVAADVNIYAWENIISGQYIEMEWSIYKPVTAESPAFNLTVRDSISDIENLPIVLPYVGTYQVELRLIDAFNNISSNIFEDAIIVEPKEVDFSGWFQSRKETYTWNSEGEYKWKEHGAIWDLPIEPSVKVDDAKLKLYESLDRVNAILNNFGVNSSDFHLINFQSNGEKSILGPYYWNNLDDGYWKDTHHLWWNMTDITGDSPTYFEFKEIPINSVFKIETVNNKIGSHTFGSTQLSLQQAVTELNASSDKIIRNYVYNIVYDANLDEQIIQAVAKNYGSRHDIKSVGFYDSNDVLLVNEEITGNIINENPIIYKLNNHKQSNPTWSTVKFIDQGLTLPPLTWIMFTYDDCKINGKKNPKWKITNTTTGNEIVFESRYLTYLFKSKGKYSIELELTDTNGNKYIKSRNIVIIK